LRSNPRLTPFSAVALKFVAGYVITAVYSVPPREAFPFIRCRNQRCLAVLFFPSPGFNVAPLGFHPCGFLLRVGWAPTCVFAFPCPGCPCGFPFWQGSVLACTSAFPSPGGRVKHWLALLSFLSGLIKTCPLSSPAETKIHQ